MIRAPRAGVTVGPWSSVVVFTPEDCAAFCASWPCHNLPAVPFSAAFVLHNRTGDLEDYDLVEAGTGRVLPPGDHDGPALLALSEVARDALRNTLQNPEGNDA